MPLAGGRAGGALALRPIFHHREDRIRAYVQLCWSALLLIRPIEHETDDTWRNVRHELDRMHLVTMRTGAGRVTQRTAATPAQRKILERRRARSLPRFRAARARRGVPGHRVA